MVSKKRTNREVADWRLRNSTRLRTNQKRRGAAVVEFALVAPILFMVVLGIVEIGRALMVTDFLTTAARVGCRAATLPGSSNSTATAAVTQALTGISGTTTRICVNDVLVDVSTAQSGDRIKVEITVPYSRVSWLPGGIFLRNATLSSSAVMCKE